MPLLILFRNVGNKKGRASILPFKRKENDKVKSLRACLSRINTYQPRWIVFLVLSEVCSVMLTFTNIYVPQFIFRYLFTETDPVKVFSWVMVYCFLLFTFNIIGNHINKIIKTLEEDIQNQYTMELNFVRAKCDLVCIEEGKYADLSAQMELHGMKDILFNLHIYFNSLAHLIVIAGIVLLVIQVNPLLLFILFFTFCLNYFVGKRMNKEGYKYLSEVQPLERKESYLLNVMGDFSFGKDVRIYSLSSYLKNKYIEFSQQMKNAYQKIFISNFKAYLFENLSAAIQLAFVYLLLAIEVIYRKMDIGKFTLYFNAINQFSNSINSLLKGFLSLNKLKLYTDDLEKFMNLQNEKIQEEYIEISKEMEEIVFDNVSFQYPGRSDYALRHVSFRMRNGEKIALVGVNGAGKTTLVKLLLRLYVPTEGRIMLNGIDIQKYSFEEYLKRFSVLFQNYKLFAFSVEENVYMGGKTDGKLLWEILNKCGLKDAIEKMPLKEKTPLYRVYDESGTELSGGEGQKLAMTRALYKDSQIVILDEPTAALDPLSEYEIYNNFDLLVENRMTVYISHRLSSTRFAQKIIVLEHGEVVEIGNHQELMKRGGVYATLFTKQAEQYCIDTKGETA